MPTAAFLWGLSFPQSPAGFTTSYVVLPPDDEQNKLSLATSPVHAPGRVHDSSLCLGKMTHDSHHVS